MDLRNIDYDLQRFRQRIFVFTVLVLVCFVLLLLRLMYLQLWRHDDLLAQAESNRTAIVPIVPNRGLIRDRTPLAAQAHDGVAARRVGVLDDLHQQVVHTRVGVAGEAGGGGGQQTAKQGEADWLSARLVGWLVGWLTCDWCLVRWRVGWWLG